MRFSPGRLNRISTEDLFRRLAEEPSRICVVTPNVRLAASLTGAFARAQAAGGAVVWEAPDVLPLGALIHRLYEDALYSERASSLPVLLSPAQELALWERVIQRDEAGSPLLSVPRTAALARDAWSLAHDWGLEERIRTYPSGEDARAFRDWAAAYERITAREAATDRARLAALVCTELPGPALRKPAELVAYGFDLVTPRQQSFFAALAAAGVQVSECSPQRQHGSVSRVAFTSARDELSAAARWARARLEASPGARIGIVVPDLGSSRNAVLRELDRVMGGGRRPFNISLGEPLTSRPVVAAGLMIIGLACGEVSFAGASRLVRSPFLGGGDAEREARARLDFELRRNAGTTLSLEVLRKLVTRATAPERPYSVAPCPRLDRCLAALSSSARGLGRDRSAREWSEAFVALLDAAGYPGERTLDSGEYQALKKFHEVLAEFASLDRVTPRMGFMHARARLTSLLGDTLFQPESDEVPVQVLGILESAGLTFDHLWVTGLTDERWPIAARPNPFVPAALQREVHVPEASAADSLALDRRITDGWLGAAGEVVLSHPTREDDRDLVASPLISHVAQAQLDDLQLPRYQTMVEVLSAARGVESIEDRAPALAGAAPVALGGGTSVFGDQAQCPFRAFARHRLGLRELEEPVPGLDPRARGTLVHELLAHLWKRLKSQAHLLAATPADLQALIAEAVETAMKRIFKPDALGSRFAAIERERLGALTREWLELEKKRPPFDVVLVEDKQSVSFGGISVNAKLDRMDRVNAGAGARHVVLDYKTGQVGVGGWLGPRPDDAQLPLYAVGRGGPHAIDGAAFARVRAGEMRFAGIAREKGLLPGVDAVEAQRLPAAKALGDWEGALAFWRRELESLGREFAEGEARVDPKDGDKTCQYCDFKSLCRIRERVSGESP